ncbi:MAG: phage tail assembly chaperone [Proteobacteria bacterium]|nr:phage tail assembly chaperone [Pseudomonadota bacterium]
MFTLEPNPTFDAVTDIPTADGGVKTIAVTWRHAGRRQLTAWLDHLATLQPAEEAAHFASAMAGWDADAPLTVAAIDQLLNDYPPAGRLLMQTYVAALTEGRTKN